MAVANRSNPRAKAPVLRLVQPGQPQGNKEVLECLRGLAADALLSENKMVGFAYVAIYERRGGVGAGVAGEPRESPLAATLARGALRTLDEELGKLVRGAS